MNEEGKITLAKCGMDCTWCRFAEESGCPGCMYCISPENGGGSKLFEDEECDAGVCCTERGFAHCGQCPEFPCDILKEISFDPDTGDEGNRLMRLKELRDESSRQKRLKFTPPFAGGCMGMVFGVIIGSLTDSLAAWIFAGTVLGLGTGMIIAVTKGQKK